MAMALSLNEQEKEDLKAKIISLEMNLLEKKNEANRLDDKMSIEEKNYERYYATMKSQYSLKDADYQLERKNNEKLVKEVEELKREQMVLTASLEKEREECLKAKSNEEVLQRKVSNLENRWTIMLKEEIEKNSQALNEKIVGYELKIQRVNEEKQNIDSVQIALKNEIVKLKSEADYHKERMEQLEAEVKFTKDENRKQLEQFG